MQEYLEMSWPKMHYQILYFTLMQKLRGVKWLWLVVLEIVAEYEQAWGHSEGIYSEW
jgi:hypothetical protein